VSSLAGDSVTIMGLLRRVLENAANQKARPASVGGLCYPTLAAAVLAPDRIDFAARLRWLLYCRKSGAVAFRAFVLSRFLGLSFHLNILRGRRPSGG
jgi:uncharacterized membrane protein YbhN (UPF0104 family)